MPNRGVIVTSTVFVVLASVAGRGIAWQGQDLMSFVCAWLAWQPGKAVLIGLGNANCGKQRSFDNYYGTGINRNPTTRDPYASSLFWGQISPGSVS